MTIYAVSQGSYSDYRVVGLYDSKDKALAFMESFHESAWSCLEFNDIEEYELNAFYEEIQNGLRPCFIRITKDGKTHGFRFTDSTYKLGCHDFDMNGDMYLYCWARDQEHAIKIAGEMRAMAIANNEWPSGK